MTFGAAKSVENASQEDAAPATETKTRLDRWRDEAIDTLRFAVILFSVVFVVRTFIGQPFHIPSASMEPSLDVGDFVIVTKFPYGYSRHSFPFSFGPWPEERVNSDLPERGDVVVFRLDCLRRSGRDCVPLSETQSRRLRGDAGGDLGVAARIKRRDYIKRAIGLPGDVIEVRRGRLIINGEPVALERLGPESYVDASGRTVTSIAYRETLPNGVEHLIFDSDPNGPNDDFGPYEVPQDHVFMMGDHRDNSTDSRIFGAVPDERLVGRGDFLLFSIEPPLWAVWRWPTAIRTDRAFRDVE